MAKTERTDLPMNASEKPSSSKQSFYSLRTARNDNENCSNLKRFEFSEESIGDNYGFHRPRCPWGRRQSYINKVKKTFLESSINIIQSNNSSSISRKPWLASSVLAKDNGSWKRPWGNKLSGVNCFCTRIEQAKVMPPSKKFCPSNWNETRRKHIVNKFDGFSKGILKITGKLSQETIAMITAKIKENLEKLPEYTVGSMYSSVRIPRNIPYMSDNRRDVRANKENQDISYHLPLSYMEPELSSYDNKNFTANAKDSSEKKRESVVNCVVVRGASYQGNVDISDDSIQVVENGYSDGKIYLDTEKCQSDDSDEYSPAHSCDNLTADNTNRNAVGDRGILVRDRGSSVCIRGNEKVTTTVNKCVLICDKFKSAEEFPPTTSSKSILIERAVSSGGKPKLCFEDGDEERPKSYGDSTIHFGDRPASVDRAAYFFQNSNRADDSFVSDKSSTTEFERPSSILHDMSNHSRAYSTSENSKPSRLKDRSVSFGDNTTIYDDGMYSIGGKSSYLNDHRSNKDRKPSTAIECSKRKRNVLSKMNVVKSSLDIVKSLHPVVNKKISFEQNRNSSQCFLGKKFVRNSTTRKTYQTSSVNCSNSYTVELVKYRNERNVKSKG